MYSVLNYIGKKEVELLEDMEVLNIETYCEPFSGSFNTGFKLIDKGYNTKYILKYLNTTGLTTVRIKCSKKPENAIINTD